MEIENKTKICIFTSAHPADDIRVYKKELISLFGGGYKIYYYTNRLNNTIDKKLVKNVVSLLDDERLKIIYNEDYNEDKRLKRFMRSFLTFSKLDKECKIYHFHDPDLLLTGVLLKMIGKKVVYDVHENYINTIEEKEYIPTWMRKSIAVVFEKFENFAAKRFDAILCATPKITERFRDIGLENVETINNYPFKDELGIETTDTKKENIIIYTGGITKKRGLTKLVESLSFVNSKIDCKLVLAGQIYPNEYHEELKKLDGWKYVEYKGLLSREEMAKELAKAKIGAVLFLPEKNHIDAQPNKLFEYMSAKIPIVCSNFPLWEQIVIDNDIGVSANPEDERDIAASITKLLEMDESVINDMRERAKKLIDSKYNWEKEEEKLLQIYKKLEEN